MASNRVFTIKPPTVHDEYYAIAKGKSFFTGYEDTSCKTTKDPYKAFTFSNVERAERCLIEKSDTSLKGFKVVKITQIKDIEFMIESA